MADQRFFIDHGIIHDRTTGKHVRTAGNVEWSAEDGIDECCALLNELADNARDGDANRYHQTLGAKWMCEAIVREMPGAFRSRNAQEFAAYIERRWEDPHYWRPKSSEVVAETADRVRPLADETTERK